MDILNKLDGVRHLSSEPKKSSRGRKTRNGLAPQNLLAPIGISLEEIIQWAGEDTDLTQDTLEALSVITGEQRATFKKIVWASYTIEVFILRKEIERLDSNRKGGRKGKPVSKLKNHELRREVLCRRGGLMKLIAKKAEELKVDAEINEEMTSSELTDALDRLFAAERSKADWSAFRDEQADGFRGSFAQFKARRKREKRRPTNKVAVKLDLSEIAVN